MINLTDKQIMVLRIYLKNPDLNQKKLAEMCNITQPEFSRLLSRAKKNIEKSISTVTFIKELGYPLTGELPEMKECIKKLKDVIYQNTLGGDFYVSEEHIFRTMEQIYGFTEEEIGRCLEEIRESGFIVEKEGKIFLNYSSVSAT